MLKLYLRTSIINKSKISKIATPPSTPIESASASCSFPASPAAGLRSNIQNSTYSVAQTLKQNEYTDIKKKIGTLQGSIYNVSKAGKTYIIKVANKKLHNKHITNWNGQPIQIQENILKEAHILKYLTYYNSPKSLVKYVDFFQDEFHYFLVMQNGGNMSLFEFVKACHEYITSGVLDIAEWHRFCKIAMKQMINLMDWLHNKMHCCHLDLSLENFVIDNVMVLENPNTRKVTFLSDFQIKIIDFGVAEVFGSKNEMNQIDFRCSKYVGKTQYKAPEVYCQLRFDARSADCHSLFVVFFTMFMGCPPWRKPCTSDHLFNLVMAGHLKDLIIEWGKSEYVTPKVLGFLRLFFSLEKYRLTIKDIKRHPWLV